MPLDNYDNLTRIAGNIAEGMVGLPYYMTRSGPPAFGTIAGDAVRLAMLIVAEVRAQEKMEAASGRAL